MLENKKGMLMRLLEAGTVVLATQSRCRAFALILLWFGLPSLLLGQTKIAPEHVYLNGKVWTADDGKPIAQAFATRGERIVAVGSSEEIRALAGPESAVTDLLGRLVVPGFNDAHWHFASLKDVELDDLTTLEAVQKRIADYARSHPEEKWITGRGWGYHVFPERLPHRKYLDVILPDRPVFLWERDGHMGLANSQALALAGITRDTKDPVDGRIERDTNGELTGELKEGAVSLLTPQIPKATAEQSYESLKRLLAKASSYGITSLQEVSAGLGPAEMAAFERVLGEGQLTVRFYVSVPLEKNATSIQLAEFKRLRDTYRGPVLKFGSAKGILDGTVDAGTAVMYEPYTNGVTGIPFWSQEELNRAVTLYDREGLQVMLHAIGDQAIHMALDAFEYSAKGNGTSGKRHRVEHIEVPLLADYPRFKKLGVLASTQALFANPDATTLNNYAVLLGPARASHANAFKLFDDAGALQAFGSDHPVFSMEVLRGIYCAVARKTPEGTPPGGWYPENRISTAAALRHFTRDGAYASFDEKEKGTLTPGKLADFVVLSDDILSAPPERILKTNILLTVMGGRETYRRDASLP
jgi:predicted amidohydrolase YtcJ